MVAAAVAMVRAGTLRYNGVLPLLLLVFLDLDLDVLLPIVIEVLFVAVSIRSIARIIQRTDRHQGIDVLGLFGLELLVSCLARLPSFDAWGRNAQLAAPARLGTLIAVL